MVRIEEVDVGGMPEGANEDRGEVGLRLLILLADPLSCRGVEELTTGGGDADSAVEAELGGESVTENFLLKSASSLRFLTSRPLPVLPELLPAPLSAEGDSARVSLPSHRARRSSSGIRDCLASSVSLVIPSLSSSSRSPKLCRTSGLCRFLGQTKGVRAISVGKKIYSYNYITEFSAVC
jgi:hypothetical protein